MADFDVVVSPGALARAGPSVDFDVKPEQRASHAERWSWSWLDFASAVSALAVVGVILIWRRRRSAASAHVVGDMRTGSTRLPQAPGSASK